MDKNSRFSRLAAATLLAALLAGAGLAVPTAAQAADSRDTIGTVTPAGELSFDSGWYTRWGIPAAFSQDLPGNVASGSSGTWVARYSDVGHSAMDFGYRIVERGVPTDYWVSAQADARIEDGVAAATGTKCGIFFKDPDTGTTTPVDPYSDSPYQCEVTGTSPGSGPFKPAFTVHSFVWATSRGQLTPHGKLSLGDGKQEAWTADFVVDGESAAGGPARDLAAGTTLNWYAAIRNPAPPTDMAQANFRYRILENGVKTNYWVMATANNIKSGALYKHNGSCEIYIGEPTSESSPKATLSPYECISNNVDGAYRNDWTGVFDVQAVATSTPLGQIQTNQLLEAACGPAASGEDCGYIPSSMSYTTGDEVVASRRIHNESGKSGEYSIKWAHTTVATHSTEITAGIEAKYFGVKASLKVAYGYEYSVENSREDEVTMTIGADNTGWISIAPGLVHIEGDYVVRVGGIIYRIPNVAFDFPAGDTYDNLVLHCTTPEGTACPKTPDPVVEGIEDPEPGTGSTPSASPPAPAAPTTTPAAAPATAVPTVATPAPDPATTPAPSSAAAVVPLSADSPTTPRALPVGLAATGVDGPRVPALLGVAGAMIAAGLFASTILASRSRKSGRRS